MFNVINTWNVFTFYLLPVGLNRSSLRDAVLAGRFILCPNSRPFTRNSGSGSDAPPDPRARRATSTEDAGTRAGPRQGVLKTTPGAPFIPFFDN
jgi:hypothetical protein